MNNRINYIAYAGITFDTISKVVYKESEVVSRLSQNHIETIVTDVVTSFSGIDIHEIKSKKRHRNTTLARQLLHRFLREYTSYELSLIGNITCRDHTTVLYSIRTINNLVETDKEIRVLYRSIDFAINELISKAKKDEKN